MLLDETGALICMNRAAEQLTEYEEADLIGEKFVAVMGLTQDLHYQDDAWNRVKLKKKCVGSVKAFFRRRKLGVAGKGATLLEFSATELKQPLLLTVAEIKETVGAIFDTVPDGVILINESGEIQLFSSGAERLFGYRRDEVVRRNIKMLMPSPYQEAHDGYLSTYVNTGIKKIIGIGREVVARRKDGSVFPIYLSIGELWLEGQRLFVGVTHDLTERKQAEQKLLTLSSAVDQSPVAIMISTKDGLIEYINDSFTRLSGYAVSDLVGKSPRLLRSNHTALDQYRRLWRVILNGREWRGEIEDRRKNGELYWAHETITPLRNAVGEITHYLAIQQDITQEKRDKEALKESESRFRHVAQLTGEWLWEQDPQERYTYSSGAVRKILGFAPEEIIGKSYLTLQSRNGAKSVASDSAASSSDCRPFYRLINKYRHKDGREIYTEFERGADPGSAWTTREMAGRGS